MEIMLVVIGLASLGLLAAESWLLIQLVGQNGRLLTRLEGIEGQLAAIGSAGALGSAGPQSGEGLPLGTPAPDFALPNLEGRERVLRDFLGKPRVLVFFSPQCGYCVQMAPRIGRLPDGGEGMLLISQGEPDEHRRLAAEHGWECEVLLQEDWQVSQAYRANGTPTGYLLDAEGRITSELVIGADALLDLATTPPAAQGSNGHDKGLTAESLRQTEQAATERARAAGLRVTESRLNREGLPSGTVAPDFSLPDLEGAERSLAEFRGRRMLLVFSDPDCGPCQSLAPTLVELDRRRGADELQVVMIGRGDPAANRAKARAHGFTFPVLLQKRWEVSKEYGIFATPVAYLIDEQGILTEEVAVGADAVVRLATTASSGGRSNGHHASSTAELLSQKG